MKPTGKVKLAKEIIFSTIESFVDTRFDCNHPEFESCYLFLTGKTEAAKYVFKLAGLTPFTDERLSSVIYEVANMV